MSLESALVWPPGKRALHAAHVGREKTLPLNSGSEGSAAHQLQRPRLLAGIFLERRHPWPQHLQQDFKHRA